MKEERTKADQGNGDSLDCELQEVFKLLHRLYITLEDKLPHIEDAKCRGTVEVDVFEVEQDCIRSCTLHVSPLKDVGYGHEHHTIHHRVVLKVDVVDKEKSDVKVV